MTPTSQDPTPSQQPPTGPSAQQIMAAAISGNDPYADFSPSTLVGEDKPADTPAATDKPAEDKPAGDAPAADDKPAGEEKPAGDAAPADDKPEADPLGELLFGDKDAGADKPVEVTEDVKSFVKAKFGFDDPEQFAAEFGTVKEQLTQAKQKADQYDQVFERISNMPYELSKAIEAAAKGEDYKPLLDKLNRGITLSKEASELDKVALVNEHYPGKFNEEELEAIKDGDKVLGAAFEKYHELASMEHNKLRQAEVQRQQQYIEQQKQMKEAAQKADAAAVAHFKSNKMLAQISDPDIIDKFLSGNLEEQTLYNRDGTKKPEHLTLVAKALAFDKMLERAREGAKIKGGDERELQIRGRMPERPNTPPGDRGQAPQKVDEKQAKVQQVNLAIAEALSM